jgi:hypothetical protein
MTKLVGRGHVVPNQADRARICVVQEIQTARTPRLIQDRSPGTLLHSMAAKGVIRERESVADLAADGKSCKARNDQRSDDQVAESETEAAARREGARETRSAGLFRRDLRPKQALVGSERLIAAPL